MSCVTILCLNTFASLSCWIYAAATRFYAGTMKKEPKLADDLQKELRYRAASAASLAAARTRLAALLTDPTIQEVPHG